MSVVWWRTLHQPASLLKSGLWTVAPDMLMALLTNLAAFVLLYGYLLAKRLRREGAKEELFNLRMDLLG